MAERIRIEPRMSEAAGGAGRGRIRRREFLTRSVAITASGVSARWMAERVAMPELSASEGRSAVGMSKKTANVLLLDMIRIKGDSESGLHAYLEAQTQELFDKGVASSGNIYHMRQQNVPESTLGDGIFFAAYQLIDKDPLVARLLHHPGEQDRWQRLGLASYSKIADYGRPDPGGDSPESIMIVISRPTDVGYDTLYNEWYTENHMIDVAKSPHFRSATRYRPEVQASGVPLAYLCIYEIESAYSPELHEGLTHWLSETPDDFRQEMPKTPAGEGVLTLDIWGYCERVWSGRSS
jgi:hypothetical protein